MPGVVMPQKQGGSLTGDVLKIGGAVGGAILGGPAGAAAGYSAGSAVDGLVEPPKAPIQGVQSTPGSINRRIETIDTSPSVQLAKADMALQQMPPEMQQAYGPTIKKAREMDAASQGGSTYG